MSVNKYLDSDANIKGYIKNVWRLQLMRIREDI